MSQSDSRYTLLYKRPTPARPQSHFTLKEFKASTELIKVFETGPFTLDFEANTNKPQAKDLWVRSVAFANADHVVAIDFKDASDYDLQWMWQWMAAQEIITFNHVYEGGLFRAKAGIIVAPLVDVYLAFKALGGKKYFDSPIGHSLKMAQVELLGWHEKGDAELDEYKAKMGYDWSDIKKFSKDIILHYNGLDADSTWALYMILKDTVKRHWDTWGEHFGEWHTQDVLNMNDLWVEALHEGMHLDMDQLHSYTEECAISKDEYHESFMSHELIAPGIKAFNDKYLADILEVHDKYIKETKTGKVSANWQKRLDAHKEAEGVNQFNLNSPNQLRWLLYDSAGIQSPKPDLSTDKESLQQIGEVGEILLGYRLAKTELQFLHQLKANEVGGKIYPNVVVMGTDTGRAVSREKIK
jgi:DNA polymerase I-like protein with 3'-5' exonuclease and polymerase domains